MKIRIYRTCTHFKDNKEYLLDLENDNVPAEFADPEDIFKLFKEEGHDVNNANDLQRMGFHLEIVAE